MAERPGGYRSYLLRLWREKVDVDWRASLQNVLTGERHVFANLEQLFVFLKGSLKTEGQPEPQEGGDDDLATSPR